MRFKFSLDVAGFDVYFSAGTGPEPEQEPQPQGSTSGDLTIAPGWDHNDREPVGFSRQKGQQ